MSAKRKSEKKGSDDQENEGKLLRRRGWRAAYGGATPEEVMKILMRVPGKRER